MESFLEISKGVGFELNLGNFAWNWKFSSSHSIIAHVAICLVYAVSVKLLENSVAAAGKNYKQPAWLESVRMVHNILLSLVSLVMFIGMSYAMYEDGRFKSWTTMACQNTPNQDLYGLLNLVYLLSKLWEWMDTYFMVLQKKPVITLHWFHHMTTFTMAAVVHNFPVGGYCLINCLVHFVMYLHYSYPVRWARPFITSGQLAQFVMVISIHSYSYFHPGCFNMQPVFLEWSYCQFVVVGYFVLFVNFFIQQYVAKGDKSKDSKIPKKLD